MEQKPVMTIRETARIYQIPEFAIRTLIKRGAFPVLQSGNRCYIVQQVFDDYLKTGGAIYRPGA
jgi:hypothetical protein